MWINKWKYSIKSGIFIPCITIWSKTEYQRQDLFYDRRKSHNIVVMSLIWYMTYPGLHDSPDSTMEAVEKFPHARLA